MHRKERKSTLKAIPKFKDEKTDVEEDEPQK
jgi:hypothetical protein